MPLKVAHLICPSPSGGAETVVRLLATARLRRGLPTEVVAVTSGGANHPFVNTLTSAGVPVTVRPARGRRYLREAGGIAAVVAERGIDILHTHVYRADFIGYVAARRAGITAVSTFHGETGGDPMNRLYEWTVKRLFRYLDAVICVSAANRDKLRAAGSDLSNVHVVRNGAAFEQGIDREAARRELGVNGQLPMVGWIGRLSHEKGPDLLLRAAQLVESPLHVVFVGDGPMRAALESQVRRADLQVTFTGPVPDAWRIVKAFDIIAMSGRAEGLPMVLLEAMAACVPVAGFQVGGIPEVLTESTGWPAPAGDVIALSRAITCALGNRRVSADRAEAAEALARRSYGLEPWVDAVEHVYKAAVARRR